MLARSPGSLVVRSRRSGDLLLDRLDRPSCVPVVPATCSPGRHFLADVDPSTCITKPCQALLGKTHDRNIKVEANLDNYTNFVSINKEIEILGEKLRGIMLEDEA